MSDPDKELKKKCELETCKGTMFGKEYRDHIVWKCDTCKAVLTVPIKIFKNEN